MRRIVLLTLLGLVGSLLVAAPSAATFDAGLEKTWATLLPGWNRHSSPVIADIDGDGHTEVAFGHQDGSVRMYEADGTLGWSSPAVPTPGPGCAGQASGSAVDSSPAVADLDRDGTPEVIVGVGSTWVSGQNGGVVVFDGATGAREWGWDGAWDVFNVWVNLLPEDAGPDGWCDGVFSTPAIGDVDGDGQLDVVFGTWGHQVVALDRFGDELPGFPVDVFDTIWSSPALFDSDGDGDDEIFIGSDWYPGGPTDHLGGWLRAYDVTGSGVTQLWQAPATETFHSSPAIADIDGDGLAEVVVGTGDNWRAECANGHPVCRPGDGGDHNKVFAFNIEDGSRTSGFPVSTGGTVLGSPAIGDVDADGNPEIVVGSWDHKVYAWNGDGSTAWVASPGFGHLGTGRYLGSPIIADLDGDGDQDVAVGGDNGMSLLDGRTGADLEQGLIWQHRASFGWSMETAPAVGELGGQRHLVFVSFDTVGVTSRVAAYALPDSAAQDDWPMFRHNAMRTGTNPENACGHSQAAGAFCDVLNGTYYAEAVEWMVEQSITTGVSPTLFGPNSALTRAQMITFLWRQEGSPLGFAGHGFSDVPAASYYANAVRWAKHHGITTGTSATTFSPDDDVTRAQLVTLLWRRAGEPTAAPSGFADVPAGRYYSAAIDWARANGITNGTSPTTFSPDDAVTRGQAAALLHREATS